MFRWYQKMMERLNTKVERVLEGAPVKDAHKADRANALARMHQAKRTIYRAQYAEFMATAELEALDRWYELHMKPYELSNGEDRR